jgi:hypothetical protein
VGLAEAWIEKLVDFCENRRKFGSVLSVFGITPGEFEFFKKNNFL